MMIIKFYCPYCEQKLGAKDQLVNQTVECPTCKFDLIVPKPPPSDKKSWLNCLSLERTYGMEKTQKMAKLTTLNHSTVECVYDEKSLTDTVSTYLPFIKSWFKDSNRAPKLF